MAEKSRKFISIQDVYEALKEGVSIHDKFPFTHPFKTSGVSKRLSLGRIWLNLLLPDELELYDEPVDQGKLNDIVRKITKQFDPETTCEIVHKIQIESFKLGTFIPSTFSSNSFILPNDIKEKKKAFLNDPNINDPLSFDKKRGEITKEFSNYLDVNDERINNVITAGIKGDDKVWAGLMIAQGYATDIEGNVLGPIKKGINDGYNPTEFYQAAAEARRGFFYKAAISADPGYLSRRVTMACAGIQIDNKVKDCGTTKTFNLFVDNKKLANLFIGRTILEQGKKVVVENIDQILNKDVKFRSPLYCKAPNGICPVCYGNTYLELQTKNIGILAGGAINNAALNSYMKMRHGSSTPQLIKVNFIKELKKYGVDTPEFKKYFEIRENEIIANEECSVTITMGDYNEDILLEAKEYFLIPGIIAIKINQEPDFPQFVLPLNYQIKLMKHAEIEDNGKEKNLIFYPGEVIVFQDYYQKESDVAMILKILDGQAKYMIAPETLVMGLHEQMSGVDLVYFEVIVSNMFRDTTDPSKPARLSNYKDFTIYGQKQLPFITSWLGALSFENPKKAIKTGLLSGADAEMNPLERLVSEKFEGIDEDESSE